MNLHELLRECVRNGIRLAENNGDLRVYFEGETPDRALLDLLRRHKQEILQHLTQPVAEDAEGIPVLPMEARTRFPASTAQRRMWLLDKVEGAQAAYNMVGAYRLRGAFDATSMRASLDAIVARHEALRTVFADMDGEVQQFVRPAEPVPFDHVDLSESTADQKEQALRRLLERENDWHFDLAAGPLFRATCADLGDGTWILVLNVHHIASDGWSIDILEREISAFYAAFSTASAITAPPPPIQYIDYAAWSSQHAQEASRRAQVEYWKTALKGLPSLHGLPLDRTRPPVQVYTGATIRRIMPAAWLQTAQSLCQTSGTTLFMCLHAALATVLGIYTNEKDIVVGFPVAGRQRKELETVVGLFVNTLVLRIALDDGMSFADVLANSRTAVVDALKHRDVPFDTLVDALRSERSPAYNPLAQIFLTLQAHERSGLRMPGLDVEPLDNPDAPVKFDLEVNAFPSGDGLVIDWRFNRSLFDDASMARMADCMVRLLEVTVREPDRPISSFDLLAPEERRLLLETWNQTDTPYPADRCIHQLFEEQVQRTPDAIALVLQEQTLTYGELDAQANRLAHYLIELGVRPDDRVAISLERSFAMVVGLLGILKAGGAYVPLDPSYPAERLAHILSDADPRILLLDRSGRAVLNAADLHERVVLDLDHHLDHRQPAWCDHPATPPDASNLGLTSRHLAYVMYTSGSTGLPKGVQNEHRAVVNRLAWMPEAYHLGAGDVVLQKTPFSFDISVWEFFWPLLHGATLALAPPNAHKDPSALIELIVRHRVTTMHFVASMLAVFLQAEGLERCTTLRRVISGGEALPSAVLRRALQRLPHTAIHNLYGPTEAAIEVTAWMSPRDFAGEIVPIGRPIANAKMYLLDVSGQPVPLGAIGELFIGGVCVARGYLNRPELNSERFLPDPFVADPEARMYRTGDLARYRADGNIEFLGRNDHQVKLRGFRIELGEIEARISEHPAVHNAVVIAVGEDDRKRLIAYIVPHDSEPDDLAASLRPYLSRVLPDYMVPAAFVTLDALPLSANGKLDRKALPAPGDDAFGKRTHTPPQAGIETDLADVWRELLGEERVGRHDHFFELGGNSLHAVRLVSRIDSVFGVRLPLTELFTHSTLSELAEAIAQRQSPATEHQATITPVTRDDALPLSFAQQRLWFLAQLDHAAAAAYHMSAALRLEGDLDVEALQATLDRIVARHENLRTRFVEAAEGPVQRFAPADIGFALTQVDLTGVDDQTAAVAHLGTQEATTPFDLSSGPLIRGQLLRLSAREHVLLVTQHHIVSDGWSIGVLIREVTTLYTAYRQGLPDPLPALAIQYADYAVWQRQWLQGAALQAQLAFWRDHLSGAPALLELPTDRPRPAVQSYAGGSIEFGLPPSLVSGLRALSQRHGTTLFMALLTGWSILMSRLSGQDDVVIGTPVANRQRTEIEPLIGFFVNTLALRTSLGDEPTVAELLARTKANALSAYAHQDVPFEQVVDALQPPRSLSHSPLFQVMLTLNNTPDGGGLTLPGLTLSQLRTAHTTTHFDLSLSLSEAGDALTGYLEYASDLFDADTVRRWGGHLRRLLEAMVADEQRRVRELPLLAAEEREQLLVAFNDTAMDIPREHLVHALFERQAAARPTAIAVAYEDQALRYAELNHRANQLAHHLIALGVRPDDRVAICVERSVEMVVGLLGILKAGGAYVPLDPASPPDRLAYLLRDSAPIALLTQSALLESTPDWLPMGLPVVALDNEEASSLSVQPTDNPVVATLGPDHLAYVIYTSGSTGQPKGVMVEHRSVINLWGALEASIFGELKADAKVGLNASISFDSSVKSLTQLLSGRSLVVIPQHVRADGAELLACVTGLALDAFDCTPLQLEQLLAEGLLDAKDYAPRAVLVGGEAIPPRTWERLTRSPRTTFFNVYGPTECTVDATICRITGQDETPHLGRPIANAQIHVLDASGQLVPIGVVGEICIGGAGVARGYLHRPELTAERFVRDPFASDPQARMYKTGDLGRWRMDGTLEYVGRNDFQVKIRGFRVELGEIEARLTACEGVREAAVLAREDVPGDKRLVAYVIAREGAIPTTATLRDQLVQVLPEYMVPSAYVLLDAWPLTTNGKLDRKALPVPEASALLSRAYEAPEGAMETALAAIWQERLGVSPIGRNDNFFELGGHSLLAVQVTSRLRRNLAIEVALRDFFAHPTLRELAAVMASAAQRAQPPLISCDRDRPLQLSFAQQRLWFLSQFEGLSTTYHIPGALRLRGNLDTSALQRALDALLDRHESLRTVFATVDGQPQAQLLPVGHVFPLIEHDLQTQTDVEAVITRLAREEALAPFDLAVGPLVRGRLLRLARTEHVLLITQHHIVSDGWSLGILINEFCALYGAFAQNQADPLPPLALQYPDYAAWQRQWFTAERLASQLDYWYRALADAPVLLTLPTDRPRTVSPTHAGSRVPIVLDAELTQALKRLGQQHNATLFMTLMAAWAAVLARLAGQDDVVIGTPSANRGRQEIEPLVGFFVNTLPLRIDLSGAPTVSALLERVRTLALAAQDQQDVPFEQIVERINPPRLLEHTPLFQVMFNWQNNAARTFELSDLHVEPMVAPYDRIKFDLELDLREVGDTIEGHLGYAADLFDADTIERQAGYLLTLLKAMVEPGDPSVARIDLLPAQERIRLLDTWNRTEAPYPADRCVHQWFEQQVLRAPDAIALVFQDQTLTYGQLNARANRLAHHLSAHGVRVGDLVAICTERSFAMVVGLLAILKAGGAYVPLDPSYPCERLNRILADADPRLLLCDRLGHAALGEADVGERIALDLDHAQPAWSDCPQTDLDTVDLTARHLAYVIYTSIPSI